MRVLVAPASFKGTLSARAAAAAIAAGVRRARPDAEVVVQPVADGGEGTLEVLGVPTRTIRVHGAWGDLREVEVGETADAWVIELARICGFDPSRREVMTASTRGVGEAIRAGLDAGLRRFVVCLGGSATCDGGEGLLTGLGSAAGADIEVACDVDAPLLGPNGAARRFGPQKGATPAEVEVLEARLARLADQLEANGRRVRDLPGAGAAGGVGAMLAALGGRLRAGAEWVLDAVGFDEKLAVDLVITGEGCVDAGSLQGKAPYAVARRAAARGVPVVVVAGKIEADLPGAVVRWELGDAGEEPAKALEERVAEGMKGLVIPGLRDSNASPT